MQNTSLVQEPLPLTGVVTITLKDSTGKVKEEIKKNLVVNTGKNFVASAIVAASASPMTHMAIGTGTTGAAVTDTTLQTELSRVAFTSAVASSNVATMTATWSAGVGTGAITEAGIFNNSIGGTMFSRVVFGVITKAISDTLTISWAITAG